MEIPGKILVLGVTKNDIRVLDKIDDESVMARFRTPAAERPASSFSEHLKQLASGLGKQR